jgi:hypothetical protein
LFAAVIVAELAGTAGTSAATADAAETWTLRTISVKKSPNYGSEKIT